MSFMIHESGKVAGPVPVLAQSAVDRRVWDIQEGLLGQEPQRAKEIGRQVATAAGSGQTVWASPDQTQQDIRYLLDIQGVTGRLTPEIGGNEPTRFERMTYFLRTYEETLGAPMDQTGWDEFYHNLFAVLRPKPGRTPDIGEEELLFGFAFGYLLDRFDPFPAAGECYLYEHNHPTTMRYAALCRVFMELQSRQTVPKKRDEIRQKAVGLLRVFESVTGRQILGPLPLRLYTLFRDKVPTQEVRKAAELFESRLAA